jgi:hypothetical protein
MGTNVRRVQGFELGLQHEGISGYMNGMCEVRN